jgi:hypothetical protein
VAAACCHAAGDAVLLLRFLTCFERVVRRVNLGDGRYARELMRERLDALLAQARQLGSAIIGPRGVVHAAGGY